MTAATLQPSAKSRVTKEQAVDDRSTAAEAVALPALFSNERTISAIPFVPPSEQPKEELSKQRDALWHKLLEGKAGKDWNDILKTFYEDGNIPAFMSLFQIRDGGLAYTTEFRTFYGALVSIFDDNPRNRVLPIGILSHEDSRCALPEIAHFIGLTWPPRSVIKDAENMVDRFNSHQIDKDPERVILAYLILRRVGGIIESPNLAGLDDIMKVAASYVTDDDLHEVTTYPCFHQ